jgi:hypothetical protein
VVRVPQILRVWAWAIVVLGLLAGTASARPHRKRGGGGKSHKGEGTTTPAPAPDSGTGQGAGKKPDKPPVLDFTGLNFQGQLHTPQLLYFLDRANEELERASLERRSFIPEMVKSVDEDDL